MFFAIDRGRFSLCWLCLCSVLGLGWALTGCDEASPTDACIDSDLGRFGFIGLQPSPGGGCEARYRDPHGALARVRVRAHRPGLFADAGCPGDFENQKIFVRAGGDHQSVSWYGERMAVEVELAGLDRPGGPVLRAYLHRYPSQVIDAVEAVERDVEMLRQTSRQRPGDVQVHLKLARNYRRLGNTEMAAHEFHIAVEKDRGCAVCYLEMGTLYRELRHWDLSIRALRKAAALRPDHPRAWLLLGDVAYDVRNRLEALRGYSKALAAGLAGQDRQRASTRLAELRDGKFMIQLLPGASAQPDGGR